MERNYDRELAEEGKELAEQVANFANKDMLERGFDEFANHLANRTHPTLQQSVMRLIWKVMQAYASKEYSDFRNEGTVKICKKIISQHGDNPPLPFV